MLAYTRVCNRCSQPITMSELSPGNWQPWDVESGRHQCHLSETAANGSRHRQPSTGLNSVETYLTRCPWCRDHVYYHTNGNGDSVYFDQLGYPWQVHPCWQQHWHTEQARKRVLQNLRLINRRMHQQRLLLLGAIHRICGANLGEAGQYPVNETTVARKLGFSLGQLKQEFGHLYIASVKGIQVLGIPDENELKIVAINPPPLPSGRFDSLGFERTTCPHCRQDQIAFRLEDHIRHCKYARMSPKEIRQERKRERGRKRPGKKERALLRGLKEQEGSAS